MSCVQYNAALGRYIMIGWFFTEMYPTNDSYSILTVYESLKPWGEWKLVGFADTYPYGWYDPGILGKFTSNDGKTMILAVGSDAPQGDKFNSPLHYYHFNVLKMKLYTAGDSIPSSPKNTNLALLRPVTASSVFKDFIAYAGERVNDGNKLTRTYYWEPKSNSNEWVSIDFGQMETINSVKVFEFSNSVEKYKIQYWEDQSSKWKDAATGNDGIGEQKTHVFSDIRTKKLRLYIISTHNNEKPRILELQAYNMDNVADQKY